MRAPALVAAAQISDYLCKIRREGRERLGGELHNPRIGLWGLLHGAPHDWHLFEQR